MFSHTLLGDWVKGGVQFTGITFLLALVDICGFAELRWLVLQSLVDICCDPCL